MRFLLGLIFGVSLTLLAVTAYTGEFPINLKQSSVSEAQESLQNWIAQHRKAPETPQPARTLAPPTIVERPAPEIKANKVDKVEAEKRGPTPTRAPKVLPVPQETAQVQPTPQPEMVPSGGRQAVWTPFHSEASAKGFAGRLSSAIGHPFQVERLAAQTYVVTFNYRTEPERATLESRVRAVTGADAS